MPFNIIPFQVQSIRIDTFSFHCMISKQNTIRVIIVNGMFLQSCTIKILGKICDRQSFLFDTFFVLFRSFRGRYTGLIVPEGLFWKRVFQTAFLCQIVVQCLRKFLGSAHVPLPCALVSTYKYHTLGQGLSLHGCRRRMAPVDLSSLAMPSLSIQYQSMLPTWKMSSAQSYVCFKETVWTAVFWIRSLRERQSWPLQRSWLTYISSKRRAFVANPLQVRMELATELVLCFPSPLCCQNPSLCRMAFG